MSERDRAAARPAAGSTATPTLSLHLRRQRRTPGTAGDTLASALLANGVAPGRRPASSCGRPRGIMAAGRRGAERARPGRGAVPRADAHRHDGRAVRRPGGARPARAGPAGRPSPTRRATTPMHAHCDVLVVGAGPAGLAAALTAARSGARVVLRRRPARARRRAARHRRAHRRRARAGVGRPRPRGARRRPRGAGPAAHHRVRLLRRRLRPRRRAAHRPPRLAAPATCPGSGSGGIRARQVVAGHRRARAPDRVRGQRPARDHARRRGPHLPAPLRRAAAAAARSCSPPTTAPTPPPSTSPTPGSRSPPSSTPGRRRRRTGPRECARARASRCAPGRSSPAPSGDATGSPRCTSPTLVDGELGDADRDRLRPAAGLRRLEPRRAPVQPGRRAAALRRRARGVRARHRRRRRSASPARRAGDSTWRRASRDGAAAAARGAGRLRPRRAGAPRRRSTEERGGRPALTLWSVPDPAERRPGSTQFVDLQRDATVADLLRATGAGPALGRARQALHDDRHRPRPGQDLRRHRLRHRRRRRSASTSPSWARRPSGRRTRPVASRRSPAATAAHLHDPSGSPPLHAWHVAHGARVRGRRAVEAAVVLPAAGRGHGGRRAARVPRPPASRVAHDGRLHARQDRRPGPGRRRVPGPALHQPDEHA